MTGDREYDSALAREVARARAQRGARSAGAKGAEGTEGAEEEHEDRWRRARGAALSFSPSPRTRHDGPGGFLFGLVLELLLAAGFHAFWPLLVRWMSYPRAAGIVGGAGLGMLCGALILPRLAFPEDRPTGGDMVGPLLTGEVVAITLAVLVLGFGGMMIALLSSQSRAEQKQPGAEDEQPRAGEEQSRAEAKRPRAEGKDPVGPGTAERALRLADPLAVAATWFFIATLLTGQFFHSPGVTAAEHLAGKSPPSYFAQPVVPSLFLWTFLAFLLALALGAMASKVSSRTDGRWPAGG